MKAIYIIGSLRNRELVIETGNKLRAIGIEGFDDWISPGPEADDYWKSYSEARGQNYLEALDSWAAQHVFEFDHFHLNRCDGAILLPPAGKSCHLEFGYIIGKGKPGWILLDNPDRFDVMYQFAKSNGGGYSYSIDKIIDWINNYGD